MFKVKNYPFSLICITLIWILSLTPFFPETPLDNVELADKWAHLVMYGGTFTVLWIEYIRQHRELDYRKLLFWALIAPIVMSGILELLQEYCTETRTGNWYDLLANAIGVVLAWVIGWVLSRLLPRRNKDA